MIHIKRPDEAGKCLVNEENEILKTWLKALDSDNKALWKENEQLKAKRDSLAEKYVKHCQDNQHAVYGVAEAYCKADFRAGFDKGYAMAIEEAKVLVECLKVVGNYLYFMGDELTGDDFVGDGALTKRYNEKLNLIEQALKEFKEKTQ